MLSYPLPWLTPGLAQTDGFKGKRKLSVPASRFRRTLNYSLTACLIVRPMRRPRRPNNETPNSQAREQGSVCSHLNRAAQADLPMVSIDRVLTLQSPVLMRLLRNDWGSPLDRCSQSLTPKEQVGSSDFALSYDRLSPLTYGRDSRVYSNFLPSRS